MKAFYEGLFGWDSQDEMDPNGNYVYTNFSMDGLAVAGLGEQPPQMAGQGIPAIWN